ncbi:hypothetical protein [Larkinella terrae]|uniref:Peptidase C-terminal archaeal/bacterial domain-containing protein n=1 Tax=Larkinella terrae TaxID=2025311 RepID=A0A7K0EU11_9BACT|nr:hypothetical protein [Larkinella terrae]MRS65300.1 hypothetical protein [Larkinella terrae]
MKNLLFLTLLVAALLGCKKEETDPYSPDPGVVTATPSGQWIAAQGGGGGFNNLESFKNFQYLFEVEGSNRPVAITLTSPDINVQYALFDPLGTRIDVSGQSRSESKQYTLNAGQYRVVVTADRRAVGKFDLALVGTKAGATRIPFESLQSGSQSWGALGGGGNVKTFKNHFYTFDVTADNLSVDVTLESADTDVELVLYDPLGQVIASDFFNSRYRYKVVAVKKGTYTVMAATDQRGSVGNYQLSVVGKVQNLKKVESQVTTVKGTWAGKTSVDTYTLQLTPNTSPLDIELTSPDTPAGIDLQTSAGTLIVSSAAVATKLEFIVRQDLAKGTYRILVSPGRVSGGPGSYTLTVHGQFSDFKKI